MAISMEQIKSLRAQTGAGVVDAKKALEEADGDVNGAVQWLREKGKATAAKKADRQANEGAIGSYVHSNGKIGVLVALNCETDFVGRNETFQELAQNIAMHIAAMNPLVVSPEDVPEEEVEAERVIIEKQLAQEGKPEEIREKIMEGKIKKFREERALLKQAYVKNPDLTIEDLVQEKIQELGENIFVKEFSRIEI